MDRLLRNTLIVLAIVLVLLLASFFWFVGRGGVGASSAANQLAASTVFVPIVDANGTPAGETMPGATASATLIVVDPVGPTATPAATATATAVPTDSVALYGYNVITSYPHDPTAFTQGLVFAAGAADDGSDAFYEGTGRRGQSNLRRVNLETGAVEQQVDLDPSYFGEGIAIFDERIYQLTWQANRGFIYDLSSFEQLGEFEYPTEGWGLTHDGEQLIMSDGTPTLYFRDPETLAVTGSVSVYDGMGIIGPVNGPVQRLNELEYIDGYVYANIWQSNIIAIIEPETGRVAGWIDLSGLLNEADRGELSVDVLNGIAWDAEGERLFVTGKLWPRIYEIELMEVEQAE